MIFWKLPIFAIACATMMILQTGCANVSPASFCAIYIPVYTEEEDSEETRAQADVNNAVWLILCQREKAG